VRFAFEFIQKSVLVHSKSSMCVPLGGKAEHK